MEYYFEEVTDRSLYRKRLHNPNASVSGAIIGKVRWYSECPRCHRQYNDSRTACDCTAPDTAANARQQPAKE